MKGKRNWFMFSICGYFLWHWVQLLEIWIHIIFDMFPEFWRLKNVIVYVVCLHVCLCMFAHVCMLIAECHNRHTERSEDNLRGSILSSHQLGFRYQTQVVRLGIGPISKTMWSHIWYRTFLSLEYFQWCRKKH